MALKRSMDGQEDGGSFTCLGSFMREVSVYHGPIRAELGMRNVDSTLG